MKIFTSAIGRIIEISIVLLLAGMTGMVFDHVVLLYAFIRALVISEEMSRFFFSSGSLCRGGARLCRAWSSGVETWCACSAGAAASSACPDNALILFCVSSCFGTWQQAPINVTCALPWPACRSPMSMALRSSPPWGLASSPSGGCSGSSRADHHRKKKNRTRPVCRRLR